MCFVRYDWYEGLKLVCLRIRLIIVKLQNRSLEYLKLCCRQKSVRVSTSNSSATSEGNDQCHLVSYIRYLFLIILKKMMNFLTYCFVFTSFLLMFQQLGTMRTAEVNHERVAPRSEEPEALHDNLQQVMQVGESNLKKKVAMSWL